MTALNETFGRFDSLAVQLLLVMLSDSEWIGWLKSDRHAA
jgi:hypothetical protein